MATLRDPSIFSNTPDKERPDIFTQSSLLPASEYNALRASGMTQIGRGFRAARLSGEAAYLAEEEASERAVKGDTKRAQALRTAVNSLNTAASQIGPSVKEFTDLELNPTKPGFSLGRIGDYALGTVGSVGGSMVDSLMTGGAAGAAAKTVGMLPHPVAKAIGAASPYIASAAAAVPSYLQAKGNTYNSMVEDEELMARSTDAERNRTASLAAVPQAAIDTILPSMFINRALGSGLKKGISSMATPGAVALESLGGGVEEVVQDRIEKGALSYLNPNRDTSGDAKDALNQFAAGMIGTAPYSAASHMVDKGYRRLGGQKDIRDEEGDIGDDDEIDLNKFTAEKPADAPKPSTFETLGVKSRFKTRAEAIERANLIQGADESIPLLDVADIRIRALLDELDGMQKDPKAQELSQKLRAINLEGMKDSERLLMGFDPRINEAAEYVLPRIGLDDKGIDRIKNNKEKVDSSDLGSRVLGEEDTDWDLSQMDKYVAEQEAKRAKRTPVDAEEDRKAFDTKTDLVAKRMWGMYSKFEDTGDASYDELKQSFSLPAGRRLNGAAYDTVTKLARDLMALTTVEKPTLGQERKAIRLADDLMRVMGNDAVGATDEIRRLSGSSPLFDIVKERTDKGVLTGASAYAREEMERSTAGAELAKLVPPKLEAELFGKHRIDLGSEQDREDMLQLFEEFADGRGKASIGQIQKVFGKEFTDAALEFVGRPIKSKFEDRNSEVYEDQAETKSIDSEGNLDDEVEANDFEQKAGETSLDRVAPTSYVFHHGPSERIRDVKDAFTPAKNKNGGVDLPQLIRMGKDEDVFDKATGITTRRKAEEIFDGRLNDLKKKAERALGMSEDQDSLDDFDWQKGSTRDQYEIKTTTAKELMDRQGMKPAKRVGLMLEYLKKEKNPAADEIGLHVGAIARLESINRRLNNVVVDRESVAPDGGQMSIKKALALRGPNMNNIVKALREYVMPDDIDRMNDLLRGNPTTAAVGVARIAARALNDAKARVKDIEGFDALAKELNVDGAVSTEELANAFFSTRHLAVAEQLTDKDYLKLTAGEFRDMAEKGTKNLKSVPLTAGFNASQKSKDFVASSMNLIRFTKTDGTEERVITKENAGKVPDVDDFEPKIGGENEVAIPAYMLVDWVRSMRNAHTTTVKGKKASDPRGEQNSKTRQTEDYRRDLLEGITAVLSSGFTKGKPYIVNENGQMEVFGRDGIKGIPNSLDLDGVSHKKFEESKQFAAQARAEQESFRASLPMGEAVNKFKENKAEESKNEELGQDEFDGQSRESIDRANGEASESKDDDGDDNDIAPSAGKDFEERDEIMRRKSIAEAAIDPAPKFLNKGAALGSAHKIAEKLWAAYRDSSPESRAKAIGNILELIRNVERPKWTEDKNAAVGGVQYLAPLAALLTPQNLAYVEKFRKEDFKLFSALRSRVAYDIYSDITRPKDTGAPFFRMADAIKMSNFLSGHTATKLQQKLDQNPPSDPDMLADWKIAKAARPKISTPQIWPDGVRPFLKQLAEPYAQLKAARDAKAKAEAELKAARDAKTKADKKDGKTTKVHKGESKPLDSSYVKASSDRLNKLDEIQNKIKKAKEELIVHLKQDLPDSKNKEKRWEYVRELDRRKTALVALEKELKDIKKAGGLFPDSGAGASQMSTMTKEIPSKLVTRKKPKPRAVLPSMVDVLQDLDDGSREQLYSSLNRAVGKQIVDGRVVTSISEQELDKQTAELSARIDDLIKGIDSTVGVSKAKPLNAKVEPENSVAGVTIVAHPSSGYRARTQHNADSAGLTVAMAVDFETAGEKLTRNVAGDKYLSIPLLEVTSEKAGLRVAKAMRQRDTTTLNVAGNGIYTLSQHHIDQNDVNQHVYEVIRHAHELRPITKIVTGGQTGVDIAGAIAAKKLGIPLVVTMPKGFVQRGVDKKDVQHTVEDIQKQIDDGADALNEDFKEANKESEKQNAKNVEEDVEKKADQAGRLYLNSLGAIASIEDKINRIKDSRGMPRHNSDEDIKKWKEKTKGLSLKQQLELAHKENAERIAKLEAEKAAEQEFVDALVRDFGKEALEAKRAKHTEAKYSEKGGIGAPGKDMHTVGRDVLAQIDAMTSLAQLKKFASAQRSKAEALGPKSNLGGKMLAEAEYAENKIRIKNNAEAVATPHANAAVGPAPTSIAITSAIAHFKKTLSPKVKLILKENFPDMKFGADFDTETLVARISTANPASIMKLAYHESIHAFYATILKSHPEAKELLESVMSSPAILQRLKDLLVDSPDAIADIEKDPEERVAYAYQFWQMGMLNIDKKPTTFFHKVQALLRRVLGEVRQSEKALALFEAFNRGELREESAAGKAITKEMARGEWRKKFMERFDAQAQAAYSEIMTSHDVLLNSGSETLKAIGNMWWSNPADPETADRPGILNLRGIRKNQYDSMFHNIIKGFSGPNLENDLKALTDRLNGSEAKVSPAVEKAAKRIHELLDHIHKYAVDAGVELGVRDAGKYFPVVWDLENLIENKAEFINMLTQNYAHVLKSAIKNEQAQGLKTFTIEDVAEHIHQALVDRGGVDDDKLEAHREDGVLNPFYAARNTRTLDWISAEHRQPFLSKDLVATVTRYIDQSVRTAEYVRVFQPHGALLKDMLASKGDVMVPAVGEKPEIRYEKDGPAVTELKEAAAKEGLTGKKADEWVARRLEDAKRATGAMEGVLGKDISAKNRKAQSYIMSYQFLRTMPLAIFSAMLDPNGIMVAGGNFQNMLDAYVHGMKNVFGTWKDLLLGEELKTRGDYEDEKAAITVGALAPTMFLEGMGAAHTSEYSAGAARKFNRAFFLANGLTVWDRSMRIMATKAAMQSIASNLRNASPEHSARWLRELGLKDGDALLNEKGQLVITAQEQARMSGVDWNKLNPAVQEEYRKKIAKVHIAVNRWVNRAIVSPNAAVRPSRASDPHFAMFFQLKSFTYAFQKTTMQYALHEAEMGNYNSGAKLLNGIPIMIASDITKAIISGGGSLPGYMNGWTAADWVMHGWNRAGLNGIGQFGVDMTNDPNGIVSGVLSTVGGPTVGQILHPDVVNAIPIVNKIGPVKDAINDVAGLGR